jgi:hypothetical protein
MLSRKGEPVNSAVVIDEPDAAIGFDGRIRVPGHVPGQTDERHAAGCGYLAELVIVSGNAESQLANGEE